MNWFKPKPTPITIVYDVLGREIDRVPARDFLIPGLDLRNRNWPHAQLLRIAFDQADMRGINLMGANLDQTYFRHCDLRGANLELSHLNYARFLECDLSGANFYRAYIEHLNIERSIIDPTTYLMGTYAQERCVLR